MKSSLLSKILFFTLISITVSAATTAQFFGMQGMINIASPLMGDGDSDARDLMDAMNVPVQGTVMGPGKSIVSQGQILNFVCGERGGGKVQCSIIIQQSTQSKLSPAHMSFELRGLEAKALHELFHSNTEEGHFIFTSIDGLFFVEATPDHFIVRYQQ